MRTLDLILNCLIKTCIDSNFATQTFVKIDLNINLLDAQPLEECTPALYLQTLPALKQQQIFNKKLQA